MKAGAYVVLRVAARLYLPLTLVFAFSLFAARPAGAGVGLLAGLAFAIALILHVVLFGAAATRAALPEPVLRVTLALGVGAALAGAGLPGAPYAAQIVEGGLFLISVATCAAFVIALAGRAASLREEAW
ncbi:MAG TPA: MnhB domain-containing protein [Caulobacterales bacterium]|nr:MnhB domain-containing protein [Caulobacterales bacterium]